MDATEIDEGLRIRSVTGVDFTLPVAGVGGRSFAFIIDLHIRAIAAATWLLVAQVIVTTMAANSASAAIMWAAVPAGAIYFLYHPIVELIMGGRTPGKRIAGIRVVMRDGSPPGAGPILVRNAFRLVDSLPFAYAVGLIACFTSERQVRIGDMAAGTLLIYDDAPTREAVSALVAQGTAAGLSAPQAELVDDLLARWEALSPERRLHLARQMILQFEPGATLENSGNIGEHDALRRLSALLRPGAPAASA